MAGPHRTPVASVDHIHDPALNQKKLLLMPRSCTPLSQINAPFWRLLLLLTFTGVHGERMEEDQVRRQDQNHAGRNR